MKKSIYQVLAIAAVVAVAAFATWKIKGTPDRTITCDPATIKAEEICLATVIGDWKADVIWIDARRRSDWQKDGLPGSLLLTTADGENFDKLMEEAFPKLAEGKKVVVYCNDVGCGTSLEIAKRIRDFGLVPDVRALHGGWVALQQGGLLAAKTP